MVGDREGCRWVRAEQDKVTPLLPVQCEAELGHSPNEFTAGDNGKPIHTQTTWTSKRSSGIGCP